MKAAASIRRRTASRNARQLLSMLVRRSGFQHPWPDHWHNFWSFLLATKASRAYCRLCGYRGPFLCHAGRRRQICPKCGSRSRHRAVAHAIEQWRQERGFDFDRALHLAPEPCLERLLEPHCRLYVSGDLHPALGGVTFDLCQLPFADHSFDLLYASHVLEHVLDHEQALAEIHRVLAPGGLALLVVPITAERTIEFGFVDPLRNDHVRECGPDYFDHYRRAGFEVVLYRSDDFSEAHSEALETYEAGDVIRHWIPFCTR